MSDQSTPPNPPSWGDQPPGGTPPPPPTTPPPPPGSGGPGYGDPYGDPYGAGQPVGLAYASWFQRVGAYLVDGLVLLPLSIVVFIGLGVASSGATTTTDPVTGAASIEGANPVGFVIVGIGYLLVFVVSIWNQVVRQGRTGWSLGKQALGIRLLKEDSGQPMGAGLCFVRSIVHLVDAIPCYLGFLWPLWDAKKQTFADKIMTTVVVQQKKS